MDQRLKSGPEGLFKVCAVIVEEAEEGSSANVCCVGIYSFKGCEASSCSSSTVETKAIKQSVYNT